jgi:hypothetical protein
MDKPGTKYHSYRQALINWIQSAYPFLQVDAFEDAPSPEHYKRWEIEAIRDASLFIAIIFDDRDEVTFEIQQAIDARNPVLLFFFPNRNQPRKKTWDKFVILQGVKAKPASTWRELIESIGSAIDLWIIALFNDRKGNVSYDPPQPMEKI